MGLHPQTLADHDGWEAQLYSVCASGTMPNMICDLICSGCTDMKRMWFVSVGALPVQTIHHEWVDLKYLEKGKLLEISQLFVIGQSGL